MPTKLIMIRGPSAIGKSTVAKVLLKQASRPTVLVELDHYRFSLVNPAPNAIKNHNLEYDMTTSDILIALQKGFDVIFDGNFRGKANDPFIKRLFNAHPVENYLIYLEGSLKETLRRHATKAHPLITPRRMRELYKYASPLGHETESIIPEHSTLDQTVKQIKRLARM
jgi:guanylate kinase